MPEEPTVGKLPLVTFALTVMTPEGESVLGESPENGGLTVENMKFGVVVVRPSSDPLLNGNPDSEGFREEKIDANILELKVGFVMLLEGRLGLEPLWVSWKQV